jgi:GGDEF domain-containing protein
MDGESRDLRRLGEPAPDDADGPGDLHRALDGVTMADDDARVRRVIEALIHPRAAAASGDAGAAAQAPPVPVFRTADHPARDPDDTGTAPDALGLCPAGTWRRLLEAEHASAARYRSRATVVLLEVGDATHVETALGEAAASRLVGVLADTVREDTRGADTFARIGRWRIAGLLPHTDGRAADAVIRRVADGFGRRLGSGLPLRLAAGRAEVDPSLHPDSTLTRAGGAMTADRGPAVERGSRGERTETLPDAASEALAGAPGGAVASGAAAGQAVPAPDDHDGRSPGHADRSVLASLRELDGLRADGLLTDDEYRKTRRRILRRI